MNELCFCKDEVTREAAVLPRRTSSPPFSAEKKFPSNDSTLECGRQTVGFRFKMPKFVPRQRKHKVIARSKKHAGQSEPAVDSNAVEHIPAAKAEIEEKKRRMKEELRKEGAKISGKKAKRLEKYIETKLKKDENRELISRLANARTDTSLYQSSRKLGQGRETKRERLSKALKDMQAGIDLDGDNEELLFEKRTVKEVEDKSSSEDD